LLALIAYWLPAHDCAGPHTTFGKCLAWGFGAESAALRHGLFSVKKKSLPGVSQ